MIIRQIRWLVIKAVSEFPPVVSVEPLLPSPTMPNHVFPALVCNRLMSHTSVTRSCHVNLKAARDAVKLVAFGIRLDRLRTNFDNFQHRPQDGERTAGSIFGHEDNLRALGLPSRAEFEVMAASIVHLDAQGVGKRVVLRTANTFLSNLAKAKKLLLFLHYLLSPGGRASELATQQILPYSNHESSIRISKGRLAIRTEINKTGKKYITRFVSPDLVPLFLVVFGSAQYLGGVVLDLLHHQDATLLANGHDHRVTYHRYMWTTSHGEVLTGQQVRDVITSCFSLEGHHDRVGAKAFRHFELWLAKEFLIPVLAGKESTLLLPQMEKNAANHGHSTRTEVVRYGNTKDSAEQWQMALSGSASEDPTSVSSWQILLGMSPVRLFASGFGQDRTSLTHPLCTALIPSDVGEQGAKALHLQPVRVDAHSAPDLV